MSGAETLLQVKGSQPSQKYVLTDDDATLFSTNLSSVGMRPCTNPVSLSEGWSRNPLYTSWLVPMGGQVREGWHQSSFYLSLDCKDVIYMP